MCLPTRRAHAICPPTCRPGTQLLREALTRLDPLWDEFFPAEQARIVSLLVERVDIGNTGLNVRLRMDGLAGLAREMIAGVEAAA
jgi:hypothetical protein